MELDRGSEGSALHCLDLRVRDRRAVATEAQTAAHVRQLGLKFTCAGWSLRPSAAVGARLGMGVGKRVGFGVGLVVGVPVGATVEQS